MRLFFWNRRFLFLEDRKKNNTLIETWKDLVYDNDLNYSTQNSLPLQRSINGTGKNIIKRS